MGCALKQFYKCKIVLYTVSAKKFPDNPLKTREIACRVFFFFFKLIIMPPLRTPLQNKSGNSRRAKDLTPYQRGKIQGQYEEGASLTKISRSYELLISTIFDTIDMDALRDEGHSLYRSGAGLSYTLAEERRILRHIRANPKDTYAQVITACTLGCSKNTVKKILKAHGIQN